MVSPERVLRWIFGAISSISVVGLGLLCAGTFHPRMAVWGGLILFSLLLLFIGRKTGTPGRSEEAKREWAGIFLLLFVALLFRAEPNRWISGTQDPGVYANFGAHLEDHPSVHHVPAVLAAAPGNQEREALVKEVAWQVFASPGEGAGRYEGTYLPGVYLEDASTGRAVFQFYPLVPMWLAIVGDILGRSAAVWSVTIFGLLSVWLAFDLARRFSGSWGVGMVAGLLFALSPLHAHFSRLPLSEVPAVCFLLFAVFGLQRAFAGERVDPLAVGEAVLAFGLFCFTRVTGFLFLPVLFALAGYGWVVASTVAARRAIALGLVGAVAVYGLSVIYGGSHSYPYTKDIFWLILPSSLAPVWPRTVVSGVLLLAVGFGGVVAVSRFGPGLRRSLIWLPTLLGALIVVVVILHAFKVYHLATTPMDSGQVFVLRFELSDQGWQTAAHSSLVQLSWHLSPFLVAGFFFVIFSRRNASPAKDAVLLAASSGIAILALFQWLIPYHYYYARYLLGESFPFVLLFTVAFWPSPLGRIGAWVRGSMACGAMIWAIYGVTPQLGFEGENSFGEALPEIVEPVGEGDVLFLLKDGARTRLQLPLEYSYGLMVYALDPEELPAAAARGLALGARDLWILAIEGVDPGEEWTRVNSVILPRREPPRTAWAARSELTHRASLELFRWTPEKLRPVASPGRVLLGSASADALHRAGGFYPGSVWTDGLASIRFPASPGPARKLVFELNGWTHVKVDFATYAISVSLNGTPLTEVSRSRLRVEFELPNGVIADGWNELLIESETFVPAELDGGSDGRRLGLDIKAIRLE